MTGDVDADHFFFACELLLRGPIGKRGKRMLDRAGIASHHAEQAVLAAFAIFEGALAGLHGVFNQGAELRAIAAQARQGSALDQILDDAAVDAGEVDALAKIIERLEGSAIPARGDDRFGRRVAHVANGTESHADARAVGSKVASARVDIRS